MAKTTKIVAKKVTKNITKKITKNSTKKTTKQVRKRPTKQKPKRARNPQAHLLGLPQELRDQIYDEVFKDATVNIPSRGTAIRNTGLPFACRQLYIETIEHYYRSATFSVKVETAVLYRWLRKIPTKRRKLMQDIRFEPGGNYGVLTRADMCGRVRRKMKDHGISLKKGVLKMLVRAWDSNIGYWTQ